MNLRAITDEVIVEVFPDLHKLFLFEKIPDLIEFVYYLPKHERERLIRIDDATIEFLYWVANDISAFDLDMLGFERNKFHFADTIEFVLSLTEKECETLISFHRRCRTCR